MNKIIYKMTNSDIDGLKWTSKQNYNIRFLSIYNIHFFKKYFYRLIFIRAYFLSKTGWIKY